MNRSYLATFVLTIVMHSLFSQAKQDVIINFNSPFAQKLSSQQTRTISPSQNNAAKHISPSNYKGQRAEINEYSIWLDLTKSKAKKST